MTRIIDRTTGAVIGALAIALIAVLAGIVSAGPLDPTTAPQPTDSVKLPGTPISSLPGTISAPGYYYLTRNLSGTQGITVTASDVTIDLGGFELKGAAGSGDGILAMNQSNNLRIMNGVITNWQGNGINVTGSTAGVVIDDITSSFNTLDGIHIELTQARVSNCSLLRNNGDGLDVSTAALVEHCSSFMNDGVGFRIGGSSVLRECVSRSNDLHGVQVSVNTLVQGCTVTSNGIAGAGAEAGIYATGGANYIESNIVNGNDVGIDTDLAGTVIVRNTIFGNSPNLDLIANTVVGDIVNAANIAGNTNPHANYIP